MSAGGRSDSTALRSAGSWVGVRTGVLAVDVTGKDRGAYLHRMLTQDMRRLSAGQWCHACYLDVRGRILADLRVWNLGECLRLVLDARQQEPALSLLARYVIADDVEFSAPRTCAVVVVGGSDAARLLAARGLPVPVGHELGRVSGGTFLVREDRGATPWYEAYDLPPAQVDELGAAASLRVDAAYLEQVRIEAGVPGVGTELGPDVMFNEARLESAITWGKGCFPGQEPVVMARDRGHPPRLLVALKVDAENLPVPGTELLLAGQPVGKLTSIAPGGAALGFVRHQHAGVPGPFGLAGGGQAWPRQVASLP